MKLTSKGRYAVMALVDLARFDNINPVYSVDKQKFDNMSKAYFASGCFWCVEESFEKLKGVEEVISGYSGGITENPTYKEVTYGNTGHFEVVEIIYDKKVISFKELLENFWINIDPFDAYGQFCDKGYSYRSVAFYQNDEEKKLIEKDIKDLQNKFNKKVVTYIRNFEKFSDEADDQILSGAPNTK